MASNNNVLWGVGLAVGAVLLYSYMHPDSAGTKLPWKPYMWLTSSGLGYEAGVFPLHRGLGYTNEGEFHPRRYAEQIGNPYITTRWARERL